MSARQVHIHVVAFAFAISCQQFIFAQSVWHSVKITDSKLPIFHNEKFIITEIIDCRSDTSKKIGFVESFGSKTKNSIAMENAISLTFLNFAKTLFNDDLSEDKTSIAIAIESFNYNLIEKQSTYSALSAMHLHFFKMEDNAWCRVYSCIKTNENDFVESEMDHGLIIGETIIRCLYDFRANGLTQPCQENLSAFIEKHRDIAKDADSKLKESILNNDINAKPLSLFKTIFSIGMGQRFIQTGQINYLQQAGPSPESRGLIYEISMHYFPHQKWGGGIEFNSLGASATPLFGEFTDSAGNHQWGKVTSFYSIQNFLLSMDRMFWLKNNKKFFCLSLAVGMTSYLNLGTYINRDYRIESKGPGARLSLRYTIKIRRYNRLGILMSYGGGLISRVDFSSEGTKKTYVLKKRDFLETNHFDVGLALIIGKRR